MDSKSLATDRTATLAIKRAGIVAVVAALGCSGSPPGKGADGGTPAACCPYGGLSFANKVRARGFTAFEGRRVEAAFRYDSTSTISGVLVTTETSVRGGAFDLVFPPDTPACSDSSSGDGFGAIWIDTDGDGVCNSSVDYLFAWEAFGSAGSTCATVDLTPQSPNCPGLGFSPALFQAAQVVCPGQQCLACGVDGGAFCLV